MARISTYEQDVTISGADKVLGTDSVTGGTKNFRLGSVLSLVTGSINVPGEDEVDSYVHTQAVTSSVWTINHQLDKYPSVVIVDDDDNVVHCNVNYQDKNNIVATFSASVTGKAYLN